MDTRPDRHRLKVALAALAVLLVLLPAWWWGTEAYRDKLVALEKDDGKALAALYANGLAAAVNRRAGLADALEALVLAVPSDAELRRLFPPFAAGTGASVSGIRAMHLDPGGVVRDFWPPGEGKELVGRHVAEVWGEQSRKAYDEVVRLRGLVIYDPQPLAIGGSGLLARKAVFLGGRFWGVVTVTIDLPFVLRESGLEPSPSSWRLALRDGRGKLFFGEQEVLGADPVTAKVGLAQGGWELAAAPRAGWGASHAANHEAVRVVLFIALALLAFSIYLLVGSRGLLLAEVERRTTEAFGLNRVLEGELAERERLTREIEFRRSLLESVAEASPDGILLVSPERHWLYQNRRFVEMWGIPADLLLSLDSRVLVPTMAARTADPGKFVRGLEEFYSDPGKVGDGTVEMRDGKALGFHTRPIVTESGDRLGRAWYFRERSG